MAGAVGIHPGTNLSGGAMTEGLAPQGPEVFPAPLLAAWVKRGLDQATSLASLPWLMRRQNVSRGTRHLFF